MHQILEQQGLGRYYALAGSEVAPVGAAPAKRTHAWLEPLVAQAEARRGGGLCALELDVQGIHCAACVWLMNEVFRREQGGVGVTVNPALGKVRLAWDKGRFDVDAYVSRIESFGYQFGPSRKQAGRGSLELPLRLGVCVALAMNVMLFSVSFYVGLAPADGELFTLFTRLSVALSTAVVVIGGWPFFRSAWRGLRTRVLHLDLPIALGILLVYGVSLFQIRSGRGDLAYFDTLNTFITLMLVGRWLQQRVLEKNRRYLLEDDGADGIVVRREEGPALVSVRAPQIESGDLLLVAPGELVPVDATLCAGTARVSTDWITGESAVREVAAGDTLPAGAFNSGSAAMKVKANTAFRDSPLVALLRQPAPKDPASRGHGQFWSWLSTVWVLAVLFLASFGFLLWLPQGADRAIEVAVALLVVTCPCAIGIAIPLSYELTQAKLRRAGFFIRSGDLLDRLVDVRKVIFDKTGTLTLGRLELQNREALPELAAPARDLAYNLAVRSSHPVSRCLADVLGRLGARWDPELHVEELPGKGLLARVGPDVFRLGRADWAVTGATPEPTTVLSQNGSRLFTFQLADAVRRDAQSELRELQRQGYGVYLLSGDGQQRTFELAARLGIAPERAFGGHSPEQKAAKVSSIDANDSLYLGDGVNDSLAFERALCAGTPAVDRPVMPGKSDFFLLGEGLQSLRDGLQNAQKLRQTVRRIVGISVAYNVLAVSVCLIGVMSPLKAAVTMPASSLSILLFAIAALRRRPERWRPGVTAPQMHGAAA